MPTLRTVAIIGASQDRRKFGNKAVRAYAAKGWTIYPVNPRASEVEGAAAYPSIESVPTPLDAVALYVPPTVGLELLPAIAAKQPRELWINPGAESDELTAKAKALGLRPILGCSILSLGMSPQQFPDE
jgi:hypothetical protein